jgi:hypothetical protein
MTNGPARLVLNRMASWRKIPNKTNKPIHKRKADLRRFFDSADLGVDAVDDWSEFERKIHWVSTVEVPRRELVRLRFLTTTQEAYG